MSEGSVRGRISVNPRGFGFLTVDKDTDTLIAFASAACAGP